MALKSNLRRQCCVKKILRDIWISTRWYTHIFGVMLKFKQLNHTWINIETIQNIFDLLTFPSLACNATEKSHPFFILFLKHWIIFSAQLSMEIGILGSPRLPLSLLQRAIVLGIKKSKLARLSYSNIYTEIGKLFFLRWDLKVHTMYIYI